MLSHAISKTNEEYIKMMNDKAKELGMTNSKFIILVGLLCQRFVAYMLLKVPDEYNQTARFSNISVLLLKNYPEF